MAFVHGHARESGWVVSHYRRPQTSGDGQLVLPAPRPAADEPDEPDDSGPAAVDSPADDRAGAP